MAEVSEKLADDFLSYSANYNSAFADRRFMRLIPTTTTSNATATSDPKDRQRELDNSVVAVHVHCR